MRKARSRMPRPVESGNLNSPIPARSFLDEIGDLSAMTQAKLLRVLQEREFTRVGGVQSIKVDVRIVAATNQNLEELVRKGQFREDLYYRINVIALYLPPLRERGGRRSLLAKHLSGQTNRRRQSAAPKSSPKMPSICFCPAIPGRAMCERWRTSSNRRSFGPRDRTPSPPNISRPFSRTTP